MEKLKATIGYNSYHGNAAGKNETFGDAGRAGSLLSFVDTHTKIEITLTQTLIQ